VVATTELPAVGADDMRQSPSASAQARIRRACAARCSALGYRGRGQRKVKSHEAGRTLGGDKSSCQGRRSESRFEVKVRGRERVAQQGAPSSRAGCLGLCVGREVELGAQLYPGMLFGAGGQDPAGPGPKRHVPSARELYIKMTCVKYR
jgi:hypothetical protein